MILRHFKLVFWLAAWSVWLWLGYGLHRELPRDFGPVVRTLPFDVSVDRPLGFLEGDDLLVTEAMKLAYGGYRYFDVWEIASGRKRQSLVAPTLWAGGRPSIPHGVVIGLARGDDEAPKESMQVLD